MSIIFAYIFYFVAASASPLQRRWLAKKKDVDGKGQIHFAFQVSFIIAVLSLCLPFFSPLYITGDAWYLAGLTFVTGIIGASFFIISYTAQKHVQVGVQTLINNLSTPIIIILSTVFLHEKLSSIQLVGTVLLLVGIFIVSKRHKIGKFTFDRYFTMLILGTFLLAIDITVERILQKTTGFTAGTLLMVWSQCLFLGIAVIISKSKSQYTFEDISITGILRFFQAISWAVVVFVVGNLSLVSAVTTFKAVVVFIGAAIFLKERDDIPQKIIGSIIAVIGLLLMK